MTEQQLIKLGFKREPIDNYCNDVFIDEKDHYYFYPLVGGMGLISCNASDAENNNEWFIDVFDEYPTIRYYEYEDVLNLINAFKKGKIVR